MLMPLHYFCDFNFNTCQTLYSGFVLIKSCKHYTLLSKCILWLLIILILSISLTYIKMHIFHLISLFIIFFAYICLIWCSICFHCRCTVYRSCTLCDTFLHWTIWYIEYYIILISYYALYMIYNIYWMY